MRATAFTLPTIFLLGVTASACTASSGADPAATEARGIEQAAREAAFWDALRITGSEVPGFDSLAEMVDGSDLVVIGRLANFRQSRQLTFSSDDIVTYGGVDLLVTEVLHGAPVGDVILLEFLVIERPDRVAAAIEAQDAALPAGDVIVFLHEKRGEGEADIYRPVHSTGMWIATEGGIVAPLRPPGSTVPFGDELAEVRSLSELANLVRE